MNIFIHESSRIATKSTKITRRLEKTHFSQKILSSGIYMQHMYMNTNLMSDDVHSLYRLDTFNEVLFVCKIGKVL